MKNSRKNICALLTLPFLALLSGGCERYETSRGETERTEERRTAQTTPEPNSPAPETKRSQPEESGPVTQPQASQNPRAVPGSNRSSESSPPQATQKAVAELQPTQGNVVKGTVTFTQSSDGVRVVAEITGLTPGEHGFHIHEKGDCSSPDAESAGAHFNPTADPHAGPDGARHHIGDMGNVTAGDNGVARLDRVFPFLNLSGSNSIVGRAVIVHANPDDLTSQPSGNAGARVACGVIHAEANQK